MTILFLYRNGKFHFHPNGNVGIYDLAMQVSIDDPSSTPDVNSDEMFNRVEIDAGTAKARFSLIASVTDTPTFSNDLQTAFEEFYPGYQGLAWTFNNVQPTGSSPVGAPKVMGVSLSTAQRAFVTDDVITVLVTFDQLIDVGGTIKIFLTVAGNTREMLATNSSGRDIPFSWTVTSDNDATAGQVTLDDHITMGNGSIFNRTSLGYNTDLPIPTLPELSNVTISAPATGDTVVQDGLRDQWLMDEGSGATAADSIGSNDLTLALPETGWFGNLGLNYIASKANQTVLPDNYVGSFTVEYWAWAQITNFGTIIDINDYLLWLGTNQGHAEMEVVFADGSHNPINAPAGSVIAGGTQLPFNTWHHNCWVFNATDHTVKFYLNGVEDGSATISGAAGLAVSTTSEDKGMRVLNDLYDDVFLAGHIGETRVYGIALTQPQVLGNFNASKTRYGL